MPLGHSDIEGICQPLLLTAVVHDADWLPAGRSFLNSIICICCPLDEVAPFALTL
jgi:hypothetical protein